MPEKKNDTKSTLAFIPPTDTRAKQVLFPAELIYKDAPEIYRRIYNEWLDSVVEPIPGFAFATIESFMQVLCGNKILTPVHGRTVVTFALCGSHSGAGKDLSSKNPLRRLRNQLLAASRGALDQEHSTIFDHLTTGIGNITGDTALLQAADEYGGSFLWLTTEASEPLRQLSTSSQVAHGGSSLATALNNSYDGHELVGKVKAGNSIKPVDYPLIPVCWLTQLAELKSQLTQKLLEIGTLGRFDYVLDYTPLRAKKSAFEFAPVIEEGATEEDIDKIVNPFSELTIEMILAAVKKKPTGPLIFREKSRTLMCELDKNLLTKYDSTQGLGKFVCRTMMSLEKRLSAWVAMDGRNIIEESDIKAMIPWLEYQVAMREQVYNREIKKDSDLLVAIKDTMVKTVQCGYGQSTRRSVKDAEYRKLIAKGFIPRSDLNAGFRLWHKDDFPKYAEASSLEREINIYVKNGELGKEKIPTFSGEFIYIPQ